MEIGYKKSYLPYSKERLKIGNKGGGSKPSIQIGDRFGKLIVIEDLGLFPYYNIGRNRRKYKCKCDCGTVLEKWSNVLKSGLVKSCGCLKSIGEYNIIQILNENNINYQKEVLDKQLQQELNRNFRFDFGIYNEHQKLLRYIEFDGEQHKDGMHGGQWSNIVSLEKRIENDKLKNRFCLTHNIPLVRIPYSQRDKITIEMLLGEQYLIKEE